LHALTGYTDRWSVKPGERIHFMVSSAGDAPFQLRFVRHLCADPNPDGPGYHETPMPSPIDGTVAGRAQPAWLGSYGVASGVSLDATNGLAITATIWPTTPNKGVQGLVALRSNGATFALEIGPQGGAAVTLTDEAGTTHRAEVPASMLPRRWYDVAASLDGSGTLRITQQPRQPLGTIRDSGEATANGAGTFPSGPCTVTIAALPQVGNGAPTSAHYNGKLERPTLFGGAPSSPYLVACWDFSQDIPSSNAVDIGPQAAHAKLLRLPTRAMTGASWTGSVHDWKAAPEQYGAIHFHDDDQGALDWDESFSLDVPEDWPSGFYAAHISNADGQDYIPFFVRPRVPAADVLFLVPTYTYQVYGCFVRPGRGAEIRERVAAWGALTETPDMNPQFGLSAYNFHSDGSGVVITSMHRPMLDTRPRQMSLMDPVPKASGTGRICSDSYFIHWLSKLGIAHDVATDHDLHEEGADLLSKYRVVIAGQHPEYYSERMMEALEKYLAGGGRLMYLGGNGFYWRAEPSEAEPHAIEVRRAEGGIRVWATDAGESYHAFGGGYGGLWRRVGRPAHRVVGNGFSVQGKHLGFPYRFTDAIRDPRVAFMTEGMSVEPGQVFGESGYMGGGAAGFELDSADVKYGTPPDALVVAKGVVIHKDYGPVNEDRLVLVHPRPQEEWSCADMVFFETAAGGAVFSVGSMTYAGSLPVANGEGTLGRLTTNVLRRFLDPMPFVS
jgi:N,N-dimethylformamidase